jgi:hypothetical protein
MQNLLSKALWFLGIMVAIFIGLIAFYSESSTKVIPKEDVEVISNKMYAALNVAAWTNMQDTLHWQRDSVITHWHRSSNKVIVQLPDTTMEMDSNESILASEGNLSQKVAKERWNEDQNNLFSHYKIFDKGVHRSVVPMEKGHIGLLVEDINGERILWSLNNEYLPESAKQLTPNKVPRSISWQDWKTLPNGMKIATKHIIDSNVINYVLR